MLSAVHYNLGKTLQVMFHLATGQSLLSTLYSLTTYVRIAAQEFWMPFSDQISNRTLIVAAGLVAGC